MLSSPMLANTSLTNFNNPEYLSWIKLRSVSVGQISFLHCEPLVGSDFVLKDLNVHLGARLHTFKLNPKYQGHHSTLEKTCLSFFSKLCRSCPNLKVLSVRYCWFVPTEDTTPNIECEELQWPCLFELDLKMVEISSVEYNRIFKTVNSLQKLSILDCIFPDKCEPHSYHGSNHFETFYQQFTQLTDIHVRFDFSDTDFSILVDTLKYLKQIALDNCCDLSEASVDLIIEKCPELTSLCLHHAYSIDYKTVVKLFDSNMLKLQTLGSNSGIMKTLLPKFYHLKQIMMEFENLKQIIKLLLNSTTLEYLTILKYWGTQQQFYDSAVLEFGQDEITTCRLHTLKIFKSIKVTDVVIKILTTLIPPNLTCIDLSDCTQLTDESLVPLLIKHTKLVNIELTGLSRLTSQLLDKITLHNDGSLLFLDMTDCKNIASDAEKLKLFRSKFPCCTLLH